MITLELEKVEGIVLTLLLTEMNREELFRTLRRISGKTGATEKRVMAITEDVLLKLTGVMMREVATWREEKIQ